MSPADARLLALLADAERDWELVRVNDARARSVDPSAGPMEAAYVALAVAHAYSAFETMLVRLERASGMPARGGAAWHRGLLADAARVVPGLRPALVPPDAEPEWERVLAFRHFLHHAYAVQLDPSKLTRVVARLADATTRTDLVIREALRALREG